MKEETHKMLDARLKINSTLIKKHGVSTLVPGLVKRNKTEIEGNKKKHFNAGLGEGNKKKLFHGDL